MTPPVLQCSNLSLSFRSMPVLEGIDLTLERGDFLGLIGPNGAGKTVLLQVILGLLRPDRGEVRILGRPPERARGLVAYVPQYARFELDFPIAVRDVVMMGRLRPRSRFGRYSAEDRRRADAALEKVGAEGLARREVGALSGGELQRVLIARALAVDAPLLLLDEPTASLDTPMGAELYDLLEDYARERTVVLVTHEIGVMSSHVKSVACMNRRLFYHGQREITQEMIEETYGCPVDFLVHRHTHRVLDDHGRGEAE